MNSSPVWISASDEPVPSSSSATLAGTVVRVFIRSSTVSHVTIYVMIFVSEAIGSRSSGFIVNTTVPVSRLTIKMDLLFGSVSVSQTKPSSGCTGAGVGVASAAPDVSVPGFLGQRRGRQGRHRQKHRHHKGGKSKFSHCSFSTRHVILYTGFSGAGPEAPVHCTTISAF